MEHMYRKVIGGPPPDEARLVSVEILKATYGRGNDVFDVTATLRSMLAEQGTPTHLPSISRVPCRDHAL
jgi:hypothetical protein